MCALVRGKQDVCSHKHTQFPTKSPGNLAVLPIVIPAATGIGQDPPGSHIECEFDLGHQPLAGQKSACPEESQSGDTPFV